MISKRIVREATSRGLIIYMDRQTGNYSLRQQADLLPMLGMPPMILHPFVVFSVVWLGVALLYSLHLSKLLLYSTQEVSRTISIIWVPFAAVVFICSFFYHILTSAFPSCHRFSAINLVAFERKLVVWFRIWVLISFFEIVISGGIPLIWLIQGSTKTYRDFGISSLHGLVNSLLLSIGLCRFALFLLTGLRKHLYIPAFILTWSILVVTRNMMLVALIEFGILFFRIRPVKAKTIVRFIAGLAALILIFGAIGDYRSGSSDLIRLWAQPTEEYPDWLPSGVLWAYVYIATPINNLIYTSQTTQPIYNFTFPNTVVTLFPTVIRERIYGAQLGDAESGQLVTSTFNVSTAYIGPLQDYGFFGVALFSALSAIACQFFWLKRNLRDVLIYSVLMQCLVLTLFFDHFLSLPVISQVIWIYYFFSNQHRSRRQPKTLPNLVLQVPS